MQKLVNLCCGTDFRRGWINIDRSFPVGIPHGVHYIECDVRQGLPQQVQDAHLICQSHAAEHFTWDDNVSIFKSCRNVLVPGGSLYIELPDFLSTIKAYMTGDWEYFNDPAILAFYRGNCMASLMDYALHQKTPTGPEHISFLDLESMLYLLKEAGFTNVRQVDWRQGVANSNPLRRKYSIYIEAIKD